MIDAYKEDIEQRLQVVHRSFVSFTNAITSLLVILEHQFHRQQIFSDADLLPGLFEHEHD